MPRSSRRFLLPLIATWALLLVILAGNALFLLRSGELADPVDVVSWQLREGGLYQSALVEDTEVYKLALYDAVRPDVVVVGSSRTLQFRDFAMVDRFLTVGAPTSGMAHLAQRIDRLVAIHRPKLMLIGVDFWWFNPVRHLPVIAPSGNSDRAKGEVLAMPTTMLVDGRLTWRQFVDGLMSVPKSDKFGPRRGLAARGTGRGFFADGSYLYDIDVLTRPGDGVWLAEQLQRVDHGNKGFEPSEQLDEAQFRILRRTLESLAKAKVPVVLFLPPLAPPMIEHMRVAGGYGYIDDFRRRLADLGVPVFDFHDPATLGASVCEFIDGMHPGDVTSLRMMRAMAAPLAASFDPVAADRLIASHAGRAAWVLDRGGYAEADFLGQGCRKMSSD